MCMCRNIQRLIKAKDLLLYRELKGVHGRSCFVYIGSVVMKD